MIIMDFGLILLVARDEGRIVLCERQLRVNARFTVAVFLAQIMDTNTETNIMMGGNKGAQDENESLNHIKVVTMAMVG